MSNETLRLIAQYCRFKSELFKPVFRDNLCADSYGLYADVLSESLLLSLKEQFERVTQTELVPTFSYLRVYPRGCILPSHIDRPACEVSGSINIDCVGVEVWPLVFELRTGAVQVHLNPGDVVIYKGSAIRHSREPFQGERNTQLILNYVSPHGPFADWVYDKRAGLGRPATREAVSGSTERRGSNVDGTCLPKLPQS